MWIFREILYFLFSFDHVISFFDNTGECLPPKIWCVPAQFWWYSKKYLFSKKSVQGVHRTRKNTDLINLPIIPAKSGRNLIRNSREKLPQQSFQQNIFFLKLFLRQHRRYFWQRYRSFSVKLLKSFRFKSENYTEIQVLQKTVPKCLSRKRRNQSWQPCGSTFAKIARRNHPK